MSLKLLVLLACITLPLTPAFCQEDEKIFDRAKDYIKAGDSDSAFMSLHALITGYPDSSRAQQSLFSIGEYYYGIGDYRDASAAFFQLVKRYPDAIEGIFSYAYMLEIARRNGKADQVKALERALVDAKRLIFLFTESREFTYTSLFGKIYKAVYTIDEVKIYSDGALFSSVSY